ncbi:hypothetical protein F4825DRAFT_450968 [Nemania diffusa]|nr:hypothetical protein F4825DRAFT_450968 [Nemania diffusa]
MHDGKPAIACILNKAVIRDDEGRAAPGGIRLRFEDILPLDIRPEVPTDVRNTILLISFDELARAKLGLLAAALLNSAFIQATELDDYHSVAPLHSLRDRAPLGTGHARSRSLAQGWHSGPVFGCPAAAAAFSRLLGLSADDVESAIRIACIQAGGLMAAQYEGMIKRVQQRFCESQWSIRLLACAQWLR